jgi:hypothetical protein
VANNCSPVGPMTDAAIKATFSSYRPVLGRKVLQLIFEVPIEAQEYTFAALGYPVPDQSLWVGIAKLNLDAQGAPRPAQPAAIEAPEKPPAKLSQIAGITCNEGGFWRFIEESTWAQDCGCGSCRQVRAPRLLRTEPEAVRH